MKTAKTAFGVDSHMECFQCFSGTLWRDDHNNCVSCSDFQKSGGFRMSRSGWGGEDVEVDRRCVFVLIIVQFYSKVLQKFDTVRAIDPGIRHIFHKKKCHLSLLPKTLTDCRKSKMSHKADQFQLYKLALEKLIK